MMSAHERPPDKREGTAPAQDRAAPENDLLGGEINSSVAQTEPPEHQSDRRKFLIWACMLGAIKPERVVERIVAEVEAAP